MKRESIQSFTLSSQETLVRYTDLKTVRLYQALSAVDFFLGYMLGSSSSMLSIHTYTHTNLALLKIWN